jgi:beta-galactosidase
MAKGYNSEKEILTDKVQTTSDAATLQLLADWTAMNADGEDVSVITVQVNDKNGLFVPTADNLISFTLDGPGKIIGVGNGDPTSHEADRFFNIVKTAKIENLKELAVNNLIDRPEIVAGFNDSTWKPAFRSQRSDDWRVYIDTLLVIRGTFEITDLTNETEINLFTKSIVENQSIYVNGHLLASNMKRDAPNQSYRLDHSIIKSGKNEYAVTGQRFRKRHQWDEPNRDPGLVQVIYPAKQWKRKAFNGLAQIIVQADTKAGEISLTASSQGLKQGIMKIKTRTALLRAAVK